VFIHNGFGVSSNLHIFVYYSKSPRLRCIPATTHKHIPHNNTINFHTKLTGFRKTQTIVNKKSLQEFLPKAFQNDYWSIKIIIYSEAIAFENQSKKEVFFLDLKSYSKVLNFFILNKIA